MTCCPPRSDAEPKRDLPDRATLPEQRSLGRAAPVPPSDAVQLPGASFPMGTRSKINPQDGEGPVRKIRIAPFSIDRTAVTNLRFAEFIQDTGYTTDAERIGWSYVFFGFLPSPHQYRAPEGAPWWRAVEGASWSMPEGEGSSTQDRLDHPVVHVSHADACAFAEWAGGRLPSEGEWEYAASGGLSGVRYPWGERDPDDTDFMPCNIWQGRFPEVNTGADGFLGTAPAQSFEPNGFGLYNVVGNVWEWTSDRFRIRSLAKSAARHPSIGAQEPHYVIKGGSYLCHRSYCFRYRIAARSSNTRDGSTGHMGFRLAYDVPKSRNGDQVLGARAVGDRIA